MVSEGDLITIQNAPPQFFHLADMPVAEKVALKKKLKTELAQVRSAIENVIVDCEKRLSQKHSAVVEDHVAVLENGGSGKTVESVNSFSDSDSQLFLTSENDQASINRKRKTPDMNKDQNDTDNCSNNEEIMLTEKSEPASTVTGGCKGNTLGKVDSQNGKGENMDITKMRECASILRKLMNHSFGRVFNQPVDPVKLNIPDYFSIICRPMDLGTVKNKLASKQYLSTHQFAADVKLTFSNAMRYNPPGNDVHIMANELNNIFNSGLKSLEGKWRKESSSSLQQSVKNLQKQTLASRRVARGKTVCRLDSFPRRSLTAADKLKLRKELANMPVRKISPQLLNFLQKKACSLGKIEDGIEVDIDIFDEEALWELQQIIRSSVDSEQAKKCAMRPLQDSCKGNGGTGLRSDGADGKALLSPSACMTCANMDCHCSHHNDFTQASSSDVESERSSDREGDSCHSIAYDPDSRKPKIGMQRIEPNSDSDGVSVVDKDIVQSGSHPSSPVTTATKGEVDLLCAGQLSPTKALRAAMLKSRFADTILKAQQKALLTHGEKVDPAKLQREREKLEKKQREEKARIEAEVKAAEAAARMKAEAEMKMQREREREAARLALQKMEKTVDVDNSHLVKDLEDFGYPHHLDMPDEVVVNFVDGFELQTYLANPLEQLGLFMKNEYMDEEVDNWISATDNGDVEEGEIGCL
ncbi:transcription factor GTE11 isoform X2 [Elaeis guineensis]|uniref:Transcription factor GTE9 isoform X2 n=1 Tax=Elaeis guineensis var. tenera TaxID=51953 RepID=A0A6I9RMI1_ELAGV|nr:transcription factor GTE9 isoform X2 [Elaeis guineensis]